MAKMINSPYTGSHRAMVDDLTMGYPVNTFCYNRERKLIFKLNGKGYLHIYKPEKARLNGIVYYYLNDYLIRDIGNAQDIGPATRYYKSIEELKQAITELTGEVID